MSNATTQDIVLTRVIAAPVEAVWRAWTDAGEVTKWWGPRHFTSPFARIDLREGGRYVFAMQAPPELGGGVQHVGGRFMRVVPLQRLEMTQMLSDGNGDAIDPRSIGMPADFPDEVPTVVEFRRLGDQTELTVIERGWMPGQMRDLSEAGMGQCIDKLAELLEGRA